MAEGHAMKRKSWGLCPQTPRIYRVDAETGLGGGSELSRSPTSPGPGVGAQVASLRCPILRPGHSAVYSNCRQAARAGAGILFHSPCQVMREATSGKATGTR